MVQLLVIQMFLALILIHKPLRYQVPTSAYHRFYEQSSSTVLLEIGATNINMNTNLSVSLNATIGGTLTTGAINSGSSGAFYSLQAKGYTSVTLQGAYLEWNVSNVGGGTTITNRIEGGTDNSIYLSKSTTANVRTKMWQFYSGGITHQIAGNTNMENAGNGY